MKNILAVFAAILFIGLSQNSYSQGLTIEPSIQRDGLAKSDPMTGANYRADSQMIRDTAKKNGLEDLDDIQDKRCLKKLTCLNLRIYYEGDISATNLRKINNTMSEIYYNYYKKYGSDVFYVSITVRQFKNIGDSRKKIPPDTVYITVLPFSRYNQVEVATLADARRILPALWHNEFIHPQFRVN